MKRLFIQAVSLAAALVAAAGCNASQPSIGFPSLLSARAAQSYGYRTVYDFGGSYLNGDGAFPDSNLIAVAGELYGTTTKGGNENYLRCGSPEFDDGCGTIFEVTPSGNERVLHRFAGGSDGFFPNAGLVKLGDTLYGTTTAGGTHACDKNVRQRCGVIFALSLAGKERVLYRFGRASEGAGPSANLIAVNGLLYGTTESGGHPAKRCGVEFGCGVVFEIGTSGVERLLYAFKGHADGAVPSGPLLSVKGALYGTTVRGGTGHGTVFKLSTSGSESVLYRFANDATGSPLGGLVELNGMLYGITRYGVVYQMSFTGKERAIYTFGGGPYNTQISAGLIAFRGALYGASLTNGSTGGGSGFIFKVTTSGAEQTLYHFQGGSDGSGPFAGLMAFKGTLYGMTVGGGRYSCTSSSAGCGTVYQIQP
jgi:uncharacterized repeat protein (TIGR03803 family)